MDLLVMALSLANAVFEAEGELYSRQLSVAHDPLINLFVGIDLSPV